MCTNYNELRSGCSLYGCLNVIDEVCYICQSLFYCQESQIVVRYIPVYEMKELHITNHRNPDSILLRWTTFTVETVFQMEKVRIQISGNRVHMTAGHTLLIDSRCTT